jgi:16S rRNA (adenine1518-N6/adenine1519-N6)-dimethyltransferase
MPAKPKLGQNFLNDPQAVERIAASLGDLSGRTVVEIGPGAGAITGALAARAAHVLAIELDHSFAAYLRTQFSPDHVTVIEQDVLTFDFADAVPSSSPCFGQRLPVFGNLPYGITSQILLKLAASHASLDRAVLMVQREVADRIAAQPGSRDYGLLSVTVQMYGPAECLFTLPPSAFSPPPDVYSTVFRWRFAPRFMELGVRCGQLHPLCPQGLRTEAQDHPEQSSRRRHSPRRCCCCPCAALPSIPAPAPKPCPSRLWPLSGEACKRTPKTERAAPPSEAAPSS